MVISYFNYLWDIDGISAGSANKAKEFIAGLRRRGHTVHLEWRVPQPTNGHSSLRTQVREVLKKGLSKYVKEPKRFLSNFKHIRDEIKIINQQQPDILFYRLEFLLFSGMYLAKRFDLPMVLEVDCPPVYENGNFYGKDFLHIPILPQKLELANLKQADAVIAISNELKNYYVSQGISSEKIFVMPNGADHRKFVPRAKSKRLLEKYKLNDKVVVGWVGSLFGWSGIENLIEMAKQVMRLRPNVHFMLVGGGQSKEFFEQHLKKDEFEDRVVLPGTVPFDQVPEYLSCMDIVLAPYPKLDFWYPSSMKVFEYMSSGKAVLASKVGQLKEIITDGENGYLFEPDDIKDLTEKVLKLVDEPKKRHSFGDNARKTVLQKYTWDKHAEQMERIFQEVLNHKRNDRNSHTRKQYEIHHKEIT